MKVLFFYKKKQKTDVKKVKLYFFFFENHLLILTLTCMLLRLVTWSVMAIFWVSPTFYPYFWLGHPEWNSDVRFLWLFAVVFLLIPAVQLLVYFYLAANQDHLLQPRHWRDDDEALINRKSMKNMVMMHVGVPGMLALMVWISQDDFEAWVSRARWMDRPSATMFQFLWEHAISLLIVDCLYYWIHRIMHLPRLYRVHKVHHQATKLAPWMGDWLDVVEFGLTSVPTVLLPIIWFNWGPAQVGFWIVLLNTHTFYQHSGLNCVYVPGLQLMPFGNQAVHHDRHHSANTGNYGSYFMFWDQLMNTTIRLSDTISSFKEQK